ncbi:MAG: adenylate/guanylate cyclase domain-containing protein [Hyphomicrobiaceae bacterium]
MGSLVPLALAAYGAFTAVRLILSYRGRLPSWLLSISILADIGLLLGLIWSFHIQYGQSAAFSLKVPTFIYIFVFIALRTLRFEPIYVVMTGGAAAIGWTAITTLAVATMGKEAITRNLADYIFGEAILIGAELDKILAIVLVTIILALAVRRAQRTLTSAVREETAAREIGRFLSKGVAEVISTAHERIEAGRSTSRHAAVLMLDIRGFTRLSTMLPPAEVVRHLSALHARIIPLIQKEGGVIDKFLGDGVMATFGAVSAAPAPEAAALRALDAILGASVPWQQQVVREVCGAELELNGAIASGDVVFATLGNGERLEYTVIGEAANLAAKLEKHNKIARTCALVEAAAYARGCAQGFAPLTPVFRLDATRVHGVDAAIDLIAFSRPPRDARDPGQRTCLLRAR